MSDPIAATREATPEIRGRMLVMLSGAGMSLSGPPGVCYRAEPVLAETDPNGNGRACGGPVHAMQPGVFQVFLDNVAAGMVP